MTYQSKQGDHWIVRMNRRNRSLCFGLLLATMGLHMADKGYGPFAWSALVLQCLLYPQLLYWRARRSEKPRQAEMTNMAIDAVVFGIWSAVLAFPLWICFIVFVGASVNLTVFGGRTGVLRAAALMFAGALLGVMIAGAHLSLATSGPVTALSIFSVSVFTLIIADGAYGRAVMLHEARRRLRDSERALTEQLREISELQAQLREQADRDPLTGLYNRRFFATTLARELLRCERERQPLSLVLIDIDHFKQINDNHGHQAGDEVLKKLAAILTGQARGSDVACRYGGEEFMLLLPTMALDVAFERAEQWRAAFAASTVEIDGMPIRATLSIGIAACPDHADSDEALIRCADRALYRAKASGRNCVKVGAAPLAA